MSEVLLHEPEPDSIREHVLVMKHEINGVKEDIEKLTKAVADLTLVVGGINSSLTNYKGMFGGISLTLTGVWIFITFIWEKVKFTHV